MEHYFGEETPKLGFGLMRLPKLPNGKIDIEQTKKMVDMFMDAGQNYFDTAYVYDGGDSERAAKEALIDRYPRESFTIATKLCAWAGGHSEEKAKQQFFTSLERTGAGYIDIICFMPCRQEIMSYMTNITFGILLRSRRKRG